MANHEMRTRETTVTPAAVQEQSTPVRVKDMRETYLITVPSGALDSQAVSDVRLACLEGLERGVHRIFVDLTGVTDVSGEAVDLLEAVGEELLAKHGTLWLANHENDINWHPVLAAGLSELVGLSPALDTALAADRREDAVATFDTRGEQ